MKRPRKELNRDLSQWLLIFFVYSFGLFKSYLVMNKIGLIFLILGWLVCAFLLLYNLNVGWSIAKTSKTGKRIGVFFDFVPIKEKALNLLVFIGVGFVFLGALVQFFIFS